MSRLFLAVDFPDEFCKKLLSIQRKFDFSGLKNAKSFHLTLLFLGEIPEEKIERINKELSKISFEPFDMKTKDLGVFPNKNKINVLWLGFHE